MTTDKKTELAHKLKDSFKEESFILKGYINILKNHLPKKADRLTKKYNDFRERNSELASDKTRRLLPDWVVIAFIIWQYLMDIAVLANIYDLMLEHSPIGEILKRPSLYIIPLLIMAPYLIAVHAYSEARRKYNIERETKTESHNGILERYPEKVKVPAKLILTGIIEWTIPAFILVVAYSNIGAAKGDSPLQIALFAITLLAFITHILFIINAGQSMATFYSMRAKGFWHKRHKLEMKKVGLEGRIALGGEKWADDWALAHNQFPEYGELYRIKFIPKEQATLNRLTTTNFVGVPAEEDRPLFPHWDPPFAKVEGAIKDKNNNSSMPGDNPTVPAPPDNGTQPVTGENNSNDNPYVDNINSVQL